MKVNGDRLLRTIDELAEIGRSSGGGLDRPCLSPAEVEARMYVFRLMKDSGLDVRMDPVANIIGSLNAGSSAPAVLSGSHVDTVTNGGKLDGCYGTLAAIEVLRTARENGLKLARPILAVCFTDEEGGRFPSMIGSKFITGEMKLDEAYALSDGEGTTFQKALASSRLEVGDKPVLVADRNSVGAFVELHIEQGPIMEKRGINVGVVENIVGVTQYDVHIEGSADHAGTTPMDMRKDTLMVAAKLTVYVNKLALENPGSVGTVGRINVAPNAPNVVAGEVNMTIDFRHGSDEVLRLAKDEIYAFAEGESSRGLARISVKPRIHLDPAKMAPRVVDTIETAAKGLGLSTMRMNSGAGHDTMIMNKVAETGMIFVPSKGGKSHVPQEATDPQDLVNGANVLLATVVQLAS